MYMRPVTNAEPIALRDQGTAPRSLRAAAFRYGTRNEIDENDNSVGNQ